MSLQNTTWKSVSTSDASETVERLIRWYLQDGMDNPPKLSDLMLLKDNPSLFMYLSYLLGREDEKNGN